MPQQMIEAGTGKVIDVPDDQVQKLFQSGKYGFPGNQRIGVLSKTGDAYTVDPKEIGKAFSKGYEFLPQEQLEERKLQKEYGGVGGAAISYGEGAVRGLTAETSDPLAIEAARAIGGNESAEAVRTHLAKYKAANPNAALAGELTGMAAPLLATGGAAAPLEAAEGAALVGRAAEGAAVVSRAAEGASGLSKAFKGAGTAIDVLGAPSRAISEAGNLTEKGLAALLGEGSSSGFAKVAKKALARGGNDAVQGAMLSLAQQANDDVLGDHELAAEKLWAAAEHGAIFGGLIGAGTTVGGALAKAVTSKAVEYASPLLKKTAEEQAVRSLSYGGLAPKRLLRDMERIPGGSRAVGREIIDSGVLEAGDTFEHIAPKLKSVTSEAGEDLGRTLRTIDGKGARIEGGLDAVEKQIRTSAESKLGRLKELNTAGYGKIDDVVGSLRGFFSGENPLTLEGLRDFRAELDGRINFERASNPLAQTSPALEAMLAARRSIESVIEDTVATEGKRLGLGSDLLDVYKAQKLRYARLSSASTMVNDSLTRASQNQMFGLGEKMLGAAVIGGAVGEISGDEHAGILAGLGAAGLAAGKGALAATAAKIIKERGNATIAVAADRIADLASVQSTLKKIDSRIAVDTENFFNGKKSKTPPFKIESKAARDKDFAEKTERVRISSADIKASSQAVDDHLDSIKRYAPQVAGAVQRAAQRSILYLASKLPPEQKPVTIQTQIHKESLDVDPAAKETYLRIERAVSDPTTLLADLTHGDLTYEAVDAVRYTAPTLYAKMREGIRIRASDPDAKPLTSDQEILLGVMFGRPLNDWTQPQYTQAMQNSYGAAGQQPPHGGSRGPRSTANSFAKAISEPVKLGGFGTTKP